MVDDAERLREHLHEVKRERDDLKIKAEAMVGDDSSVGGGIGKDGDFSSMQMGDILAERKAYEAEVRELTLATRAMRDELKLKEDSMNNLQM